MARKKWVFQTVDKPLAKELAAECDIDPMVSLLLAGRGFTDPYAIDAFLECDQQLSDPFELPDMQPAAQRIKHAIDNREIIAVCGDYDADGVTASALLYSYLSDRGCRVICDIPERLTEGYGLHKNMIDRLHAQQVSLMITVDNGINAIEEIAYANSLAIDVVVTDHHRPGDRLPPAVAVVDPHIGMPPDSFADYAGVGVAFKLVCALEDCPCEELLEQYGDLVAIGTVADVVPLRDENRILVQQGLRALNHTHRIGLQALIEEADILTEQISADQIAYGIAPRINAAGRMGESFRAFRLLTTDDENEARRLAGEICHENMRRQDVEAGVSEACRLQHLQSGIHFYDRVIVIAGYGWHHGVLGIVAARLCNQFGKPVIILSIDGATAKGSARSLQGFDMFQALTACSEHLLQLGGHTLAAGLTVATDKIDDFRNAINAYARSLGPRPLPTLSIDCKLSPLGANEATANAIRCLAPHGCANPVPVFALMRMELYSIHPVGGGRSLRLTFVRDTATVVCMKFGMSMAEFPYQVGDVMDLAVVFRYSTYKNRPAFSLVIQEMRPSGLNEEEMFHQITLFERFMAGEPTTGEERACLIPTRDDLAVVYRYLRQNQKLSVAPDVLLMRLSFALSAGQLLTALHVFEEFGFVNQYFDADRLHITFLNPQGKFDLSNSEIILKLQS